MRKNFSKSIRLYDIADGNALRPAFGCVIFRDGYAYATNSFMMIKAKLEHITNFNDEELAILEGKAISAESLKRVYSHQSVDVTNDGFVTLEGDTGCKITYSFTDPKVLDKFPDCEKALKEAIDTPLHPKAVIGINYGMLDTLTNAMGCKNNSKLEFHNKGLSVVVRSLDLFDETTIGLLMLKQIDDDGNAEKADD